MSPAAENDLSVLIEIPKGSRNKYEFDKEKKRIHFDRMLHSSVHYPCDYGFIENTLGLDSDPLDALVLVWEPTFPGCHMYCRPVGVLEMRDDKGQDEKILCVPVSDPVWNHIHTLADAPPHLLKEIEHFFQIYKHLEDREVHVDGWAGVERAKIIIHEAFERAKGQP